jgi:hypothetical protein
MVFAVAVGACVLELHEIKARNKPFLERFYPFHLSRGEPDPLLLTRNIINHSSNSAQRSKTSLSLSEMLLY